MENPFFDYTTLTHPYYEPPRQRYYYHPAPRSGAVFSPGPTTRSVPVRKPAEQSAPPRPKVVSIPVRFVGTEKSRAAAAAKIQKALRGFLVRKAVRKVLDVAAEVAEVERRVARKETAEKVRREERERLRLNETLMGLLFRLDSIRGFDSVVRECRKRVIRRVIALQERLDAIAASDAVEVEEEEDSRTESEKDEVIDSRRTEMKEEDEAERKGSEDYSQKGEEGTADSLSDHGVAVEGEAMIGTQWAEHADFAADSADTEQTIVVEETAAGDLTPENATPGVERSQLEHPAEKSCHCDEHTVEPNQPMGETVVSSTEAYGSSIEEDKEIEPETQNPIEDDKEMEETKNGSKCGDDVKCVMERMVDENVKLQRMVANLCERNVVQSRLINSLSQRVEQLEKVMAKKKKKRQATGTVEDLRKCGKKL
ncbi:hypothetical protein H6P81_011977 [Aristolochia fimbriata]|uniref:BAG domain-containing protein n=1 Tax=Aristolochia fimbriata TaxID=158543 RepID=A0AAV7EAW1_ARIFI|nr:hypothetical protein H6P81_011977 [Aristolochia fimbriata]